MMNKLGTMKICPKCGNEDFTIIYEAPIVSERLNGDEIIIEKEYMKVVCNKCRYEEKEAPLDATENKEK